jgi:diguanylate cyclase (GGDEF)-like protein
MTGGAIPTDPRPGRLARQAWSIRRWLGFVLVMGFAGTMIAISHEFFTAAGQVRDKAIERMSFRAERAAESVARVIDRSTSYVESVAAQPGMFDVFDGELSCVLAFEGGGAFPAGRTDAVSAAGQVLCSSDPSVVRSSADHAGSGWLTEVAGKGGAVTLFDTVDPVTQRLAIAIAVPVRAADGDFRGAVTTFLQLPGSADSLAEELLDSEEATLTIVDPSEDRVLSSSGQLGREPVGSGFGQWPSTGEWTGVDGAVRLFGSSDIPQAGWRIYVGAEKSAVLSQVETALLRQILIGGLAFLALALAIGVLYRRIALPLRSVTEAVVRARVSRGEDHVAEVGTSDVINLAREFNTMLDVRSGHEAQLVHQATHDPLTGLPNRMLLKDRLDRSLQKETELAVLFCGLPRFKFVTEGLSHDAGDRLLADAAGRLQSVMRRGDILARFGDDEFVVVCEGVTSSQASRVAERLHDTLSQPFTGVTDSELLLGAAIGIAVSSGHPPSAAQLLREADSAMRRAKKTGHAWALFEDDLRERAAQRLEEAALRRAIVENQLEVWYQPVHRVETGRLVGAEALVRWQHPTRGLLPPSEFVPLAEETGLISAVGRVVLRRACQETASWVALGAPMRISVNVAVDDLHQPDFVDFVQSVLTETGLDPELLCLELTESSIMTEIGKIVAVLTALRGLGVHVAIDDFGTGYSSLSYLPRLPVSELKIDRSFISGLAADSSERHLVRAIVGMARALELTVVAEGVETPYQLGVIADLQCDLSQGFLFGAPMPSEMFRAQLARREQTLEAVR